MKNILTKFFFNSWTKTLFFICLCIGLTYFIINNFTEQLVSLINWRKKETWVMLSIMIPTILLLPTFLNTFVFLKIVQIADNTKQQNTLLKKQNVLLQQILENKNK